MDQLEAVLDRINAAVADVPLPLEKEMDRLTAIIDHPRLEDAYYFWTSLEFLITGVALYLLLIPTLLAVMRNRQPLDLYYLRVVYNLVCVLFSGYMAIGFVLEISDPKKGFKFMCNDNQQSARVAQLVSIFFWTKFIEFLDTIIMILRKRTTQLSFLHIWHHSSICVVAFLWVHYAPGGDSWFPAFLNSFVHTLMYSHYLLRTIGANSWWSSMLTQLQLLQFFAILGMCLAGLYTNCGFPQALHITLSIYLLTMIVLFGNFYVQKYLKGSSKKDTDSKSSGSGSNAASATSTATPSKLRKRQQARTD